MRSKYNGLFQVGQKFGKWITVSNKVIKISPRTDLYGSAGILVKCECGTEKLISAGRLIRGKSNSCNKCINGKFSDNPAWKGVGSIPGRYFNMVKRGADRRNIPFNLTIEYLDELYKKQNRKCALTGDSIFFSEARKYKAETSASLDRINNDIGYEIGNVQFVSKKLNFAKHKSSEAEFLEMCKKVVEYSKRNSSD